MMIRKAKGAKTEPKTEERGLQRREQFWNPWSAFGEIDRWFDDVRREFDSRFPRSPLARWHGEGVLLARTPLVDLLDEGREFVVKAELPGVSKEDLDIRVTEDGIELEAQTHVETEAREKEYYYRERADRAFHRALSFPDTVVPGEARATLKDGVLEVRVPRKEPAHRQEPVKVRVE